MARCKEENEALDHLTTKATEYLTTRSKNDMPFFLYFPMTSPHKPVLPAPRFRGKSGLGDYGDFVMHADWVVGQIQKTLTTTGLADNTLFIVISDNGSYMYRLDGTECPTNLTSQSKKPDGNVDHVSDPTIQGYLSKHHRANGPWRGTKADIWKGCHRIPFMARWPGRTKPGSRCDRTICLVDLMATVADILDTPLPDNTAEDSFSLKPLLLGHEETWERAPVIHHSSNGTFALRKGKWKLIAGSGSGGRGKPSSKPSNTPYQLYDMQKNPGETTTLVGQYPGEASRLTQTLNRIIQSGRSRPET